MSDRRLRKAEASPSTASAFDRLPLNALRVFESVATNLSFQEAAEALHVTPAAVSMQIKTLEDYVQTPLFRRNGRTIELTPEGSHLLPGVRRGLTDLQQSIQQLRQIRASGALHLTTISSFLQKWLLPRLPQFHAKHQGMDLRIHTSRTPVDFRQTDFHCAIRMVRESEPSLYYEKILDEWFLPVCSPDVFAKHGELSPDLLGKKFPLLHSANEPWKFWTEPQGKSSPKDWTESGSLYDDSLTVLAAAEQGQGYALTRWAVAARDIEIGRLVRGSSLIVPCPRSYYFVCPESYLAMPKV
ncbi:MAG TPA: LysR family transcriptional regulator, partial [Steroidobacteraceae bacterium]|nr:LysR family transcriptional regulator [Steroidobacteraceae bacterium]